MHNEFTAKWNMHSDEETLNAPHLNEHKLGDCTLKLRKCIVELDEFTQKIRDEYYTVHGYIVAGIAQNGRHVLLLEGLCNNNK